MKDVSKFGDRLRELMAGAPLLRTAKAIGIAENSMRNYLDKGGLPGIDNAVKIADYFRVSLEWLITGEGNMLLKAEPGDKCKNDTIPVPVLRDVKASAGLGNIVDSDGLLECAHIPKNIIPLGLNQELSMIFVDGDSMEPTLRPGEPIVVNRSIKDFVGTGIYIVRWDSCLYVKRLDREPDGTLHIISDNNVYHEFTIKPEAGQLVEILGKVIMKWRLL